MSAPLENRRPSGCFLTAPLGCLAFTTGALAVGVVFMPLACGRILDDALEEDFVRHFQGRLELDRVRMPSFHGRQELEFELSGPDGAQILHGELGAPRITLGGSQRYGPVELRLSRVRIATDEQGVTNLERSFAPRRGEAREEGDSRLQLSSPSFDELRFVDIVFSIDELEWSDGPGARSVTLRDVRGLGDLDLAQEARLKLAGTGQVTDTREVLAFELELRGLVSWLEPALRRPSLGQPRTPRGLSFQLAAREVAAATVDTLLGTGDAFEERFSQPLVRFSFRVESEVPGPAELHVGVGEQAWGLSGPRTARRLVPVGD